MPMYEFRGSARIIANSQDEAYDILDSISELESFHMNEIEEVE